MKRTAIWSVVAIGAIVAAPIVRADVKTSELTQFKLAGMAGALMNRFGGQAARDGVTSTIAVRGSRKSQMNDLTGQIIDLNEQKVYTLDMKKKEYTVKTFDQIRADYEKERADAAKNAQTAQPSTQAAPAQPPAQQMQFDFDVKETGQHKTLIGRDAHEVIVTLTGHQQGQTLEQGGGFVMTNDIWMGPKIAALEEIGQFEVKYYQAIYGESFGLDVQQMAQVAATLPAFQTMSGRMQTESAKLQGTPLASTTTMDSVMSTAAMAQASQDSTSQPPPTSGGGLGGMLGHKLMGNKGNGGAPQQRTTALTSSMTVLSLDASASDADVALPMGFKEKK